MVTGTTKTDEEERLKKKLDADKSEGIRKLVARKGASQKNKLSPGIKEGSIPTPKGELYGDSGSGANYADDDAGVHESNSRDQRSKNLGKKQLSKKVDASLPRMLGKQGTPESSGEPSRVPAGGEQDTREKLRSEKKEARARQKKLRKMKTLRKGVVRAKRLKKLKKYRMIWAAVVVILGTAEIWIPIIIIVLFVAFIYSLSTEEKIRTLFGLSLDTIWALIKLFIF